MAGKCMVSILFPYFLLQWSIHTSFFKCIIFNFAVCMVYTQIWTILYCIIITSASLFKVLITLSKALFSSLNLLCWLAILSFVLRSASSCVLLHFSSSSLHLCSCAWRTVNIILSSCFNLLFSSSRLLNCLRTYV